MSAGTYKLYETHDNGGRLFRVFVDKAGHTAYISSISSEDFCVNVRIVFRRVFIGKSNESAVFSGPEYDGNSILFELDRNEYLFVGDHIFRFHTAHPLRKFVSPVGRNDVPYPFAVDTKGDYYILTGDRKVKIPGELVKCADRDDPFHLWSESIEIAQEFKVKILIPGWHVFRQAEQRAQLSFRGGKNGKNKKAEK